MSKVLAMSMLLSTGIMVLLLRQLYPDIQRYMRIRSM